MQKYIIPLSFFAVIFLTYGLGHPEWCNYHEQYQFFMFGWDYLIDHLTISSGLSGYLAEFMVQFFFYPWLGAAVWAAFLTGVGLVAGKVSEILSPSKSDVRILSFIVPAMLAVLCGDENVMLAFPMSVMLALLSVWGYGKISVDWRMYLNIIIVPVVFWAAGYGVLVYVVLASALECQKKSWTISRFILLSLLGVVLYLLVAALVSRTAMRQYQLSAVFTGFNFFRARVDMPMLQHLTLLIVVAALGLVHKLPSLGKYSHYIYSVPVYILFFWGSSFTITPFNYRLMYADYLIRNYKWNDMIEFAEKNPPESYLECTALNLALAMQGQLSERMFEFPQYGQEGLITRFGRDMVSCVVSGEACFYLGLLNTSHRLFYDTQESIMNCNKSARFSARIAECLLLCERYETASNYAAMLRRTLFYSSLADRIDDCVADHSKISKNTIWSIVQHNRLNDCNVYDHQKLNELLLKQYQQSPNNKMALEYSLAADLLNVDMEHFIKHFPLTQGGRENNFGHVQKSYQEALAMEIYHRNGKVVNMPYFISPDVQRALSVFDREVKMGPANPNLHKPPLSFTFWHYVLLNNR